MSHPVFKSCLPLRLTQGAERLREFCVQNIPGIPEETAGSAFLTPLPHIIGGVVREVSCHNPDQKPWSNHLTLAFSPIRQEMMSLMQEMHDAVTSIAPALHSERTAWQLQVGRKPGPVNVSLSVGYFLQPELSTPSTRTGSWSVCGVLEQMRRVAIDLEHIPAGDEEFLISGRIVRAKHSVGAEKIYDALARRRQGKRPQITCISDI